MIDHAYRVPIPTLGLNARLIVSEREHPREAQPELADLFVHVKAPVTGAPTDDELIARFEECLDIFERKKKLGLLYERPSRIKISRLNLYMRDENGDPFTLDVMIALFTALVEHLDRTRDPGDGADDASGDVSDSQDSNEFSEEEDPVTFKEHDHSGSGKVPRRSTAPETPQDPATGSPETVKG